MPTLRESLEALPHRDVRGIATRLGVRRRDEHHKADWIEAILHAWQIAAQRAQIVAGLSPAAREAAGRLAQGGEFPTQLFLAEYGAVRRPRPGQHWLPPPWEAPQTISEELYYCGLLAAAPPALLEKAVRLALPTDLQLLFADDGLHGRPPAAVDETSDTSSTLLHDVAQALCFLVEQPGLTLLHGRWLAPTALAELNSRLLRPEPQPKPEQRRMPLLRSHARTRRLRFLFFLATAAGLCAGGNLTPLGWTWLAEPPAARLLLLWNAWRTAPATLRQVYRQATAALPEPWPTLALKYLVSLPPAFTAAQLAQAVLGQETTFATYFTAHLPDISTLDAVAASLIETLTEDWGALAPTTPRTDLVPSVRLTELGRWLNDPAHGDLPSSAFGAQTGRVAWLNTQKEAAWQLIVSPWAPPLCLARLAAYARHVAFDALHVPGIAQQPCGPSHVPDTLTAYHIYHLDEAAVATAAAAGHDLPILLEIFTDLSIHLSSAQLAILQAWHARGHEVQFLALPLLRTARPEILARLLADANVRAGLGELLSPTIAVTTVPPADLAARLRAAGFFPQGVDLTPSTPPSLRGKGDGGIGVAALWLAGQLYATLSQHTVLPLPPPFADLTALLTTLPPLDQTVVQAQWEKLHADLQMLLDGRTFAPPPEPSDPERWRPLIESAIATSRSLTMRYFTAGRNVLTQRTVAPYWIENHRGIPYLRADCHLSGRVLLFRLDRIQALTIDDGR